MALINKEDLIKDIEKKVCGPCGEYTKYNGAMCRACRVDDVIDLIDHFEEQTSHAQED